MEAARFFSVPALVVIVAAHTILIVLATSVPENLGLVASVGIAVSLGVWFVMRTSARRALARAATQNGAARDRAPSSVRNGSFKQDDAPGSRPVRDRSPEEAAVHVLAILQREGRLIDFLQEDIRAYDDAQIGAAVRNVHDGCRKALSRYVTLAPVMDGPEGRLVTVESGFDARSIRLTGDVVGDPPFKGILRHRGWRVEKIDLPELMQAREPVLAAAEIEVEA